MKNVNKIIVVFLLVLSMLFISTDVYAGDYSLKELIPVSDEANVYSKTFNYTGVKFETGSDGKVNGILRFTGILNNTGSRKSPSFNILLFDGAKKNIGYITYCAEKDYGSDNSMFYIPGKESKPFTINVTSRYFGGNEKDYKGIVHEPGEIVYYSFFSDNSYCQIGGYTKYIDLTIEEITGGEVNFDNKEIDEKLKMNELILYLPYLLIGLVALIGYGLLLNSLYKRMHARTSILSYIPMTNLYIAVKLAFGKKIAWGFYLLCILSLFIAYSSSSMTFTYILIVLVGIATLLDIIKLITGKYDMFVVGKKKHKSDNALDDTFATNSGSRFIDEGGENNQSTEAPVTANDFLNSINNGINDQPPTEQTLIDSNDVVDISYDSDVPISEDAFVSMSGANDSLSIGSSNNSNSLEEEPMSFPTNNTLTPVSNVSDSTNTLSAENNTSNIPKLGEEPNQEASGESELSNFFR